MTSPALPFSAAQRAALQASAALQEIGGGVAKVYIEVPENAKPPYTVIGQDEIDDLSDGCGESHSIFAQVQWWARDIDEAKGSAVVRQMGAAIIAALLTELTIEGHTVVLAEMEVRERYGTDPDGSSRGLVGIRYETTAQDP